MHSYLCGSRQTDSGAVNANVSKIVLLSDKREWTIQPLWPRWPCFHLLLQPKVLHRAVLMFPFLLVC